VLQRLRIQQQSSSVRKIGKIGVEPRFSGPFGKSGVEPKFSSQFVKLRFDPNFSCRHGLTLPIIRFLHTGEVLGLAGQALAGLASLAGCLLVWSRLALAWRRLIRPLLRRVALPGPDLSR